MATLRSHGPHCWPRYKAINGTLSIPCMHGGGIAASPSSVAGWISGLTNGAHWISGTSARCLALFKPVCVDTPIAIGPIPDGHGDGESLWWRHEHVARMVMRDPDRLANLFLAERDTLEARWLTDLPEGQAAFDEGSTLIDRWASTVAAADDDKDVRPIWARRHWAKRDEMARSATYDASSYG